MIAEQSGRGLANRPYDYSAHVFACETGNASRFDGPPPKPIAPTQSYPRDDARYFPLSDRNSSTPSNPTSGNAAITSRSSQPTISNATATTMAATAPVQSTPLPQRARGQADRSSSTRGRPNTQTGPSLSAQPRQAANVRNGSQPSQPSPATTTTRQPTTQEPRNDNPNARVSRDGPNTEIATAVSWADDNLSDVELISASDESVALVSSLQSRPPIGSSVVTHGPVTTGSGANQRPATMPQGGQSNNNGRKGEKRSNDGQLDRNEKSNSYSDAAKKYQWGTVESKRSKRNSAHDDVGSLLGAKTIPHREIFVKHLDYTRCSKPAELENMVKTYCRRRGVFILQARVFEQSDCDRANCRVSVRVEDVEKALDPKFWPEYAVVRNWSATPLNDNANGNEGDYVDADLYA